MYRNRNELPKFWKTQWFRLLIALAFFVMALVMLAKEPENIETIEGLRQATADMFGALCNILTGMFWVCSAVMEHNSECIRALEKRVIQLEDQCITDIDEVEPNHFVAKRRCGPDKK